MNDTERLNELRQHVRDRLDYLARFLYHHDCNIPEPTPDDQFDYHLALGEQRALLALLPGLTDDDQEVNDENQ